MRKMKWILFFAVLSCTSLYAVPTLQVYIPGAVAGTQGQDEDTWFKTGSGAFDIVLVGAYGPKTQSITNCVLVVSVPQGQSGSVSVAGASQIGTYTDKSFLPDKFNEHFPLKSSVSDFATYDVGSFINNGPVHNYDADSGQISTAGSGQEKTFAVNVTGFTSVHFDLYGYVTNLNGQKEFVCTWDINPGSHDATWNQGNHTVIPAPGALLLASFGTSVISYLRKRETL